MYFLTFLLCVYIYEVRGGRAFMLSLLGKKQLSERCQG